jgi:hypothetical protein
MEDAVTILTQAKDIISISAIQPTKMANGMKSHELKISKEANLYLARGGTAINQYQTWNLSLENGSNLADKRIGRFLTTN